MQQQQDLEWQYVLALRLVISLNHDLPSHWLDKKADCELCHSIRELKVMIPRQRRLKLSQDHIDGGWLESISGWTL